MNRYISDSLRKKIVKRANHRCEYCLIFDHYSYWSFHIEHIVSLKHGGKTVFENLAYACPICNWNKGSDIATFLTSVKDPIRFFNPRIDDWHQHFKIEKSGIIVPTSNIGEATLKILEMNHPESVIERELLISGDLF